MSGTKKSIRRMERKVSRHMGIKVKGGSETFSVSSKSYPDGSEHRGWEGPVAVNGGFAGMHAGFISE